MQSNGAELYSEHEKAVIERIKAEDIKTILQPPVVTAREWRMIEALPSETLRKLYPRVLEAGPNWANIEQYKQDVRTSLAASNGNFHDYRVILDHGLRQLPGMVERTDDEAEYCIVELKPLLPLNCIVAPLSDADPVEQVVVQPMTVLADVLFTFEFLSYDGYALGQGDALKEHALVYERVVTGMLKLDPARYRWKPAE